MQNKFSFLTQAFDEDSGESEQNISNSNYGGYVSTNSALLIIGGGIITIAALRFAINKINLNSIDVSINVSVRFR